MLIASHSTKEIAGLFAFFLSTSLLAPSIVQAGERGFINPRVLGEGIIPQGLSPPSLRTLPHEKQLDLNIVYTDGQIYNPATGAFDKVRLRSYNGTDVDSTTPYVSPTIEVQPGDTIRVNLNNRLPADATCSSSHTHANEPHCFNGTNLHTHGLWVNPAGNGDNVLLSINPGVSFQYEYKIPPEHAAGTFWYHTHRHGSTALQVSSGMAGALIVRGNRLPNVGLQGDLDTILAGFPERVMVFQQIQYACREPGASGVLGAIKTNADGSYRCDPGDVGGIEGYDQFGPNAWGRSGRYTTINGVVLPTVHTQVGQIERWRMIHGGVRDTISLKVVEMVENADLAATFTKSEEQAFIQKSCTGQTIAHRLVAADGLTLAAAKPSEITTFQPGYRFDALMVFAHPGRYCVINASAQPAGGSVNGETPGPELLSIVSVDAGGNVPDPSLYLKDALVAKAKAAMPASVVDSVVTDLGAGLKLSHFVPHLDIADEEVTGTQELTFFIDVATTPPTFEISKTADTADAEPYDPTRMDRLLTLGGVDEWKLQSGLAGHPFHIHVNPFQIVSILDPNGKDVSAEGAIDDAAGGAPDPQYPGLKGVWKDTVWVKAPTQAGRYTLKVRTRYQRYIGAFVLHCHILDHEDQGMMQNVAVVLPEGNLASTLQGKEYGESHTHP